jgi:hypothetical protein
VGDGIFIQLVEENKYKVLIRIQIKIRGQNITAGEVDEIRDRMNTRGKFIIKQIQERWQTSQVTTENIFFTTQHYDEHPRPADVTFRLMSRLDLVGFWPDDVKLLGDPYASNKQLTKFSKTLIDGSAVPRQKTEEQMNLLRFPCERYFLVTVGVKKVK